MKIIKSQHKSCAFVICLFYFHGLLANEIFFITPTLHEDIKFKRISLISLDVEITEINSSSVKNASAQWTFNAQNNIRNSLNDFLTSGPNEFSEYRLPDEQSKSEIIELISLQSLVNNSILSHIQFPLPSKNNFNWSIGSDANLLKYSSNADYGLFFSLRAGFSGANKIPGYQVGMVSLVDLNSGQTVWFVLQSDLHRDIRDKKQAYLVIYELFETLPKTNT